MGFSAIAFDEHGPAANRIFGHITGLGFAFLAGIFAAITLKETGENKP